MRRRERLEQAHLLYQRVAEYFPDSALAGRGGVEVCGYSVAAGQGRHQHAAECEGAGGVPAAADL